MTKSSAPKILAEKARDKHRKTAPKVLAEKARDKHRKTAPKVLAEEARDTHRKTAPRAAPEKAQRRHRKTAQKVAAEKARDTHRKTADQFEKFRDTQEPDSMRALAEGSVAQTRELYQRSKNNLQALLESWEKSFGAARQGAVTLNRKIIDIAERNINTGFDLAMSLAGAKNLSEAMELQAAYWRKQFGELRAQVEEVRALSTKVSGNVAEPIKAQVTRMSSS
jgi:phasin